MWGISIPTKDILNIFSTYSAMPLTTSRSHAPMTSYPFLLHFQKTLSRMKHTSLQGPPLSVKGSAHCSTPCRHCSYYCYHFVLCWHQILLGILNSLSMPVKAVSLFYRMGHLGKTWSPQTSFASLCAKMHWPGTCSSTNTLILYARMEISMSSLAVIELPHTLSQLRQSHRCTFWRILPIYASKTAGGKEMSITS